MGVPTSEVGYTSATTGRGDQEVHKGHVVSLEGDIQQVYALPTPYLCVLYLQRSTGCVFK
jgi:hypothetical protein